MTNNPSPIYVIKPKVVPIIIVTDIRFIICYFVSMVFLTIFSALLFHSGLVIFFTCPGTIYIMYRLISGYYKNSSYELYEDYLIIKTNFIGSSEVKVQYKNILDIAKYQGPLQASFDVHDIIIRLAGDHHNYRLTNLKNAQTIVDFISKTRTTHHN